MPVSSNQYRAEIGSFYNRLTGQIKEFAISLLKILVNFTEYVSVYVILIVKKIFLTLLDQLSSCNLIINKNFLTLLDQLSSCNILYLWSFMTHLFYFKLLTSFWQFLQNI